jgi:hypothetical protein
MFFHISIHNIKAISIQDHPHDALNRRIELYHTWHLAELEKIDASSPSPWARMGSSARGAPDGGTSFRKGDDENVVDPQITLALPDDAIAKGVQTQYRLDFHHWESDDGDATEKVRAAFTDITLKYMAAAWKAANEDADKAQAALEQWVKGNWKDSVKAIAAATAAAGSPWVAVGLNLLPGIELLVDLLRNQADDYFDQHRFILQRKGDGDVVQWQVTDPGGAPSGWKGVGDKVDFVVKSLSASRANDLAVTYRFRLID